jgi:hypothetical protein
VKPIANDILNLLEIKHGADVFVPECKDGPSQFTNSLRLDAWAMRRSWTKPWTFGYEIKVSRSDFLGDDKWRGYLDLCSDFYFVCPKDLIKPDELPPEAGLLYASSNYKRLYTKKKAPCRNVTIPDELWRYILMCRATVGPEQTGGESDVEYWERWLADKKKKRHIGGRVAKRTADEFEYLRDSNVRLRNRIRLYRNIRKRIKEMGVDSNRNIKHWEIENKLSKLRGDIPKWVNRSLDDAEKAIERVKKLIEEGG